MKLISILLCLLSFSVSAKAFNDKSNHYLVKDEYLYNLTEFLEEIRPRSQSLSLHFDYYFDTSDSVFFNNHGYLQISRNIPLQPELEDLEFRIKCVFKHKDIVNTSIPSSTELLAFDEIDPSKKLHQYDSISPTLDLIKQELQFLNNKDLKLFIKVKYEQSQFTFFQKDIAIGRILLDRVDTQYDSANYHFNLMTFEYQNDSLFKQIEFEILENYPNLNKIESGNKIVIASDSLKSKLLLKQSINTSDRDSLSNGTWLTILLLILVIMVLYMLKKMRMF